jgi:hypothetical protein
LHGDTETYGRQARTKAPDPVAVCVAHC